MEMDGNINASNVVKSCVCVCVFWLAQFLAYLFTGKIAHAFRLECRNIQLLQFINRINRGFCFRLCSAARPLCVRNFFLSFTIEFGGGWRAKCLGVDRLYSDRSTALFIYCIHRICIHFAKQPIAAT